MAAAAVMSYFLLLIIAIYLCTTASANDPFPMQDFCVADFTTTVLGKTGIRPFPCKNPTDVKVEDFYTSNLNTTGDTNNTYHAALKSASVLDIPGLNTMGFTLARADLESDGSFPLHYHQRASEVVLVIDGCLEAGFVTSESNNYTLFSKQLQAGDVLVIPMGLIHYWKSCGTRKTRAYAILNSQNPGISSVTHSVFGTTPPMNVDYLAATYLLDKTQIQGLQATNWSAENL